MKKKGPPILRQNDWPPSYSPAVPTPQSLRKTMGHYDGIELTWSVDRTGLAFLVFRSEDGRNFKFRSITTATAFLDSDIVESCKYWYRVCANTLDGCSKFSNIIFASVGAETPKGNNLQII